MTKTLYDLESELGIKNNSLLQWVNYFHIPKLKNKKRLTFTPEAVKIFYRIVELKNDYKFEEMKPILEQEFPELIKTAKTDKIDKSEIRNENTLNKEHIELIIKNEVSNIESKLTSNLQEVFKTEFQTLVELSKQIGNVSENMGALQAENKIIKELSENKDNTIEKLQADKSYLEVENKNLSEQLQKAKSEIELLRSELEKQKTEIERLSKLRFWNRRVF